MTRADRLAALLPEGCGAVITSRANIFYYSGFTSEDATLFITKNRRVLVTDSRYTIQARGQSPEYELRDISEGMAKIASGLDCTALAFEEDYLTVRRFNSFREFGRELVPMQKTISSLRSVKDAEEIRRIKNAEELGDSAFSHLLKYLKAGMTEREAALILEEYMRRNGAEKTSFDTIAASGLRSAMPHGTATDKPIERGDLLTLDFGCVLDGYCSDMTRTVAIGEILPLGREIYETVLAAQLAGIAAAAPGKPCAEIDRAARSVIEAAGYGDNFGHSLGHSVGIEIHEAPCFSPKSPEAAEPGNVITVEPGIYIDGFGGVRIEDVIVIGEKTQNLTKSSKELIII